MSLVRLQKVLAQAGIGSRRSSEAVILAGRVSVNGEIIRQLGTKIQLNRDRIAFDGIEIAPARRIYLALHKPPGYLCTRSDAPKKRLIGNLLPAQWSHLFCVGRLDADSEGLIFMTNDGDFSNRICHPRFGTLKTYRVAVRGFLPRTVLPKLIKGVVHQGEKLHVARVRLLSTNNTQSVLELVLNEGKNREIRRLLQSLGFQVSRLVRVQIGPVKLGELPLGKWRTLTESEINSLLAPL